MNYIQAMAERIMAETPQRLRPSEDGESLFTLYALLAVIKGSSVCLEDVHDAWSAWMTLRSEQHRSLVPFADLDQPTQEEDRPFCDAILRAIAKTKSERP